MILLPRLVTLSLMLFVVLTMAAPATGAPCFPAPWYITELARHAPTSPLLNRSVIQMAYRAGRFYGVDPRLPLAIAGQETGFGTNPSAATCLAGRKAWGIMVCRQGRCTCRAFANWEDGVREASRLLGVCYLQANCDGFRSDPRTTIPRIGERYCGSGPECAPWARNVRYFYRRFGGISTPDGSGDRLFWGGGCCADCSRNGQVDVTDLVTSVNINLAFFPFDLCPTLDLPDRDPNTPGFLDRQIDVSEIVTGVNEFFLGCPVPN